MNRFVRMIPITRFEPETGLLHGVMAEELPDKVREVMDYKLSKPHFQKWSDGIAKASDGKSLGNVREMHSNSAVGVIKELTFDDVNRKIPVVAKIVDPLTKVKIAEGVLTAFSIGGFKEREWEDQAAPGVRRYIAVPSEVSVVDNPCMYGTTFSIVKADGSEELRKFTGSAAFSVEAGVLKKLGLDGTLKKEEREPFVKTISGALDAANGAVASLRKLIAEYALAEGDPSTWGLDDMKEALARALSARSEVISHASVLQSRDMKSVTGKDAGTGGGKNLAQLVKAAREAKGIGIVEAGLLLGKALGASPDDPKGIEAAARTIQDLEAGTGQPDEAITRAVATSLGIDPAEAEAARLRSAPPAAEAGKGIEPGELRKLLEGVRASTEALGQSLEKAVGERVGKEVAAQVAAAREEFKKSIEELTERLERTESTLVPVGRPVRGAEKVLGGGPPAGAQQAADLAKAVDKLVADGHVSKANELEVRRAIAEASIAGLGR